MAVLVVSTISLVAFGLYKQAFSETLPSIDWIGKQPTVQKTSDLTNAPIYNDLYSNRDCDSQTVSVYRSATNTPNETQCMVPVAAGLMEHEGQLIQPPGYNKTYPLTKYIGYTNYPLIPVPNQSAALQLSPYSTGVGMAFEMYKNFFGQAQYATGGGPQFKIIAPPEERFRYGDGTYVRFNFGSLSFAPNGRYFIADTVTNGFMKVDLLNLGKQPIATSLPRDGGGGLLNAATAIDADGRFAAIAYGAPGSWGDPFYKVVDTEACSGSFNNSGSSPPTFSCPTVDLRPQLEAAIPNLYEIRNVRFVNNRTMAFVASTFSNGVKKYARYSVTAGGQQKSLTQYLAIGDSYISGEGAYNYREGTDTERNRCHQSTFSYPYLLSVSQNSFASVACSGARARNVTIQGREQQYQVYGTSPSIQEQETAKSNHVPGFILQSDFLNRDNPEVVTVSIGGNDIRFSDIIKNCVSPIHSVGEVVLDRNTCYASFEDRLELVLSINDQAAKLNQLYSDLRNNGENGRRVYVIGYPQVAKVDSECGVNVRLNRYEVKFAHDLIEYFNTVIEKAAKSAGVMYVDTQQAFNGHRLCEGDGSQSAMNGLTIGKTSWGDIGLAESFHPNKNGHEMLASHIAMLTQNLTKPMTTPTVMAPITTDLNMPLLKDAPRTNRVVRHLKGLSDNALVVQRGETMPIKVDAQAYLTKPNSQYQLVLQPNNLLLGSVTSDAQGNITAAPVLPANSDPGFYTLQVWGKDLMDNDIALQQIVYVIVSSQDYDGDGVDNDLDTCALVEQSGIDRDVDSIDDACDPVIGAAPQMPPNEEGIIWRDDTVLELEINTTSGP